MSEYHWAANESSILLKELNKEKEEVLITFIPPTWYEDFKNMNYETYAIWNDYFNNDISKKLSDKDSIESLKEKDCKIASDVTLACKNQSRGFSGQTEEWMKQWVSGVNSNNEMSKDKDSTVLIHREEDKIVGVACLTIYGHNSEKGAILWIREIAVLPDYQNRGIGKKMLNQALHYGKDHGATRGFLAADESNENAIRLYKKIGFVAKIDEAQIDMIKVLL